MKPNLFNSVKVTNPGSNHFDLSHDFKFSGQMGNLMPVLALDCIPGDKITITPETMIRFAPMLAPIMHRVDVSIHYFFVPNRIIWPNWEKFITNTPLNSIPPALPAFPTIDVTESNYNRLMDYLGLPTPVTGSGITEKVSALPFAAYQKVFDEYYRDQNLVPSQWVELQDGDNTFQIENLRTMRRRAWEHDYFTACLPFAQKGAAVEIPVTQNFEDVPVRIDENRFPTGAILSSNVGGVAVPQDSSDPAMLEPLFAKTSEMNPNEPTTINDLRRAFKLQEWLEKAARGGSRYIEQIKSFFGVQSSDQRLQRPEYITGIKTPVQISEVLNTTGTDEAAQGTMAGHGIGFTTGKSGSKYIEEHGYVIGIMSVMPKTAYQQGIPKHFLKTTDPFDYYWPQFAHIGEQPVLNKEVFAYQSGGAGEETFGYVPRYSEYKFMNSRVAGDFKTTLDFWHMGRIFETPPALNEQFISADPTQRIFAVTDPDEDKLWIHLYNRIHASRKMPVYGTPTF